MEAFKAKISSTQGIAVRYQKDNGKQKKGFLRLESAASADGPVETLVLKEKRPIRLIEDRIEIKDVIGAFGSESSNSGLDKATQDKAIVLVAATRSADNRSIRLSPWRLTIDDDSIMPSRKVMKFLCSGNNYTNGVLTNFLPTAGVAMTGNTIAFFKDTFNKDGLTGSLERFPLILQVSSQLFEIGQWAGAAAPVFAVFASMISRYETVQGQKLDLIDLLARFGRVERNLPEEKNLKGDLLALAEDFFFMPGWRRHFASKDFQGNLTRLADRMDRAVQSHTLQNTVEIKYDVKKLVDRKAASVEDEPFDWMNVKSMLPPTRLFMGREDELEDVRLNIDKAVSITSLVGVAGCGKSHLAREAASEWNRGAPDGEHRVVLFVNASSELSSRASVVEIMERLGLQPVLQEDGEAIPTKELSRRVRKRIAEAPPNVKFLLILDDAPVSADGPSLLKEWFGLADDRCWSNKCVIVTSQSSAYADETSLGTIEAIPVQPLPTGVSRSLLMKKFPILQEKEDEIAAATELVTDFLHNLPVAILAVSGLIWERSWTFKGYLRRLEEKQVKAGVDSVRNVLQDALAEARKDSSLGRVLDVAAFVGRDSIPLSLLEHEELVEQLCALNLLQVVMDEHYSMHGLIQEVAQIDRSPRDAIVVLERALESYYNDAPDTWPAAVALLPHVEPLRRVASDEKVLKNLSVCDIQRYGRVLHTSGLVYNNVLCQFESSRVFLEDSLVARRAEHKETGNHESIAKTLHDLARVYRELGNHVQSKQYSEEALAMFRVVYKETPNHASIAKVLHRLGDVYEALGDYEQSMKYYKEALAMFRAVYKETPNHANIAQTLEDLGRICEALGDYEQSEQYSDEAFAMFPALRRETTHQVDLADLLDHEDVSVGEDSLRALCGNESCRFCTRVGRFGHSSLHVSLLCDETWVGSVQNTIFSKATHVSESGFDALQQYLSNLYAIWQKA